MFLFARFPTRIVKLTINIFSYILIKIIKVDIVKQPIETDLRRSYMNKVFFVYTNENFLSTVLKFDY